MRGGRDNDRSKPKTSKSSIECMELCIVKTMTIACVVQDTIDGSPAWWLMRTSCTQGRMACTGCRS